MQESNSSHCVTCELPIPGAAPDGICPRCLLREGLSELTCSDTRDAGAPPVSHTSPEVETTHPADNEDIAKWFPQLEIFELLGVGGMGRVYRARQTHLERVVALKILSCPPESHEAFALRFEQEAKLLARLHHPNIVTLFDFGIVQRGSDVPPLYYFLMEYVEGASLLEYINQKEITPANAFHITALICEALQFAHEQGVLHRDIKPANLLMTSPETVKLADFGIAKIISANSEGQETGLTLTGTSVGTPFYMAPEIWENPAGADHRADLYSLGAVLYHMLTGECPSGRFERPSVEKKLPRIVDAPVWKALAKNPDDRYGNAESFRMDATRIERQLNRAHRSRLVRFLLLFTLIPLCLGLALWSQPGNRAHSTTPPGTAPVKLPALANQGRIYLHYAGSDQGEKLESTSKRLDASSFTLVYSRDIESREKLPISTEVRYFRDPEEKAGAAEVLALLKQSEGFEDARLLYVSGYDDVNRENHFEIWLGRNSFAPTKSIGRKLREQQGALKSGYLRVAHSPATAKTDLSRVGQFTDIFAVRSNETDWYALRRNGSLISSNENHTRLYIDSITGDTNRPVALVDTGGEIEIFGSDGFFPQAEYPAILKQQPPVACEVGSGHALALLENGEVIAWGPRYARAMSPPEVKPSLATPRWPQPPPRGSNHIAIAVTPVCAAALQATGNVTFWNALGVVETKDIVTQEPIRSIQSAGDTFLLLTASGSLIQVHPPTQEEEKSLRSETIAEKVSTLSSHFYYSAEEGWQSALLPDHSNVPWKTLPETGPGQISLLPSSRPDQPAVLWVQQR